MDHVDDVTETDPLISRDALQLVEAYREAETKLERKVAGIWCAALRLDKVGLDDNFFDLGGDSLSATAIASAASDAFALPVQPSQLMNLCTVAKFAEFAVDQTGDRIPDLAAELPANIAVASDGGAGAPVFMIHGLFGVAFPSPDLLAGLRGKHPVYYVSGIGFYDDAKTPRTLEDTARTYLALVRQVAASSRFHLIGMCAGSGIAHDMGRQAAADGDPVLSVTLVDPPFSRIAGLRRRPAWFDKISRLWYISFRRFTYFMRCKFGLVTGEAGRLAATHRQAGILTRFMATADGSAERLAGLRRERIGDAQMALEAMFVSARHQRWDGPVSVVISAQRNAEIPARMWRRFTPVANLRVIGGGHPDLFRASARATSAALAEFIGGAEEPGNLSVVRDLEQTTA